MTPTNVNKVCLKSIKAHNMPILCAEYDPSGCFVATGLNYDNYIYYNTTIGSSDRSVRVWDVNKYFCTHVFKDHSDIIEKIYFHPNSDIYKMDSLILFSCSADNSVNIYNLCEKSKKTNSYLINSFNDHLSIPTCMTLSHDGFLFVSGGRDKVIIILTIIKRIITTISISDN